ncbi:MAG: hypothetical protein Ct9H300mP1_28460 [Planctomycetaceae bacterium]|nr:MAG: hypothetical protein Ct9H300mP1_28460 [Planctomycetaceae bacterium]
MPPLANSNFPILRPTAPVKAPASWPNSSLSRILSGNAEMFSGTKGLDLRSLFGCRARATSSLPVPLSPSINTVLLGGAHVLELFEDAVHRRAVADDSLESEPLVEPAGEFGLRRRRRSLVEAFSTAGPQFVDSRGLVRYIDAPAWPGGQGRLETQACPGQQNHLRGWAISPLVFCSRPARRGHPSSGR